MVFSDENEEVWSDYDESDEGNLGNQSDKGPELLAQASNDGLPLSLLQWLLGFFLLLQAQFSLSEKVINMIFGFLKLYFNVLGRIYAPCTNIAAQLPLTSFMARKCYTGKHLCKATFQRFPVCKRCGTVWNYDDCIEGHSIRQTAKLCSYTSRFSRGHYLTQECKGILLKTC